MSDAKYQILNVKDIIPNKDNPRIIDAKSVGFLEFVESIKGVGVLVPVHVRLHGQKKDKFELLAGERRLVASKAAGKETIPAVVYYDMDDQKAFELTIAENFLREDLTILEESKAADILLKKYKGDAKAAASVMGKTPKWIQMRANIHKGLSKKWRDELSSENSVFSNFTSAHLALLARLPHENQDMMIEDSCWIEDMTVDALDQRITKALRLVTKAAWNVDDDKLLPDVGSCSKCGKRSSVQPQLWDDLTDEEAVKKNDRCLDDSCWDRKVEVYLLSQIKELRKEHPGLVIIATEPLYNRQTSFTTEFNKECGQILQSCNWENSKKEAKGALPAIVVHGKDQGNLRWIKIIKYVVSACKFRGGEKTMKQKRAELDSKRWFEVLKKLDKILEKVEIKDIAIKSDQIFGLAAMAVLFGTRDSWYDLDYTQTWEGLRGLTKNAGEVVENLWRSIKPRLAEQFLYNGPITQTPEHSIRGAKTVAKIISTDIEAMFAEAAKAISEPKSWATLKSEAHREKTAKKKKAAI